MRQKTTAAALSILIILAISSVAKADLGVVRIINQHPFVVEVHSQNYNYYGQPYWVFVTHINPNSYVDLPNVPAGALLGLQTPNSQYVWRPFQVYYSNPYNRFSVYYVQPMR